jgi:hypothetical protein
MPVNLLGWASRFLCWFLPYSARLSCHRAFTQARQAVWASFLRARLAVPCRLKQGNTRGGIPRPGGSQRHPELDGRAASGPEGMQPAHGVVSPSFGAPPNYLRDGNPLLDGLCRE